MKKTLFVLSVFLIPSFAQANHYLPINFVNQSNLAKDEQVYIAIKAMTHDQDCMMTFDANHIATCEPITSSSSLKAYNYPLSELGDTIYLPQASSGRIYISVGYPMQLHVDEKTNKIVDPDGFNPRDANYYTLYDKVEFTFNELGAWMNPTAVDFFSLPLRVSLPGSTSDVTEAGFLASRNDILHNVRTMFAQEDKTHDQQWNRLLLTYDQTVLRLMAPGKTMVSIPNARPFDPNYLNNSKDYGFNYTEFLWNYYKQNTLEVDCSILKSQMKLNDYHFRGHVEHDQFVFRNRDNSYSVSIDKPKDSRPFFAGAGDAFDAPNNTPKAIIIRELTSAFEVGLLPAKNGIQLNKAFFKQQTPNFYKANPQLPNTAQGPWYDLYSKALHSFGTQQPIYTFAYDDALGQDGTLHDPSGTNPTEAMIIIGDMSNTKIPNPYEDKTTYTITPIIGFGSDVVYQGKPLQSNQTISDVHVPFHVTVNGVDMDLYIQPQMVRPYSRQSDGIVIEKTGEDKARVTFPAR